MIKEYFKDKIGTWENVLSYLKENGGHVIITTANSYLADLNSYSVGNDTIAISNAYKLDSGNEIIDVLTLSKQYVISMETYLNRVAT